jgi:hypothetical protein
MAARRVTAVGFRVKSGWASAVLITGPVGEPAVLDRRVVQFCDRRRPETRQPYHAGTGREETDSAKIRRRVLVVRQVARRGIADLLASYRERDLRPRAAGLVVGSLVDPESIANPHIRAHALEGKLFRTVLISALRAARIPFRVFRERDAVAEAQGTLGIRPSDLIDRLKLLGRSTGRPWGADEKLAALAAWMALARRRAS